MYTQQRFGFGVGGGLTPAVKNLLIANGIAYLLQLVAGPQIILALGLVPKLAWSRFTIWQFATYMFLHGNFFHILMNMYALWIFGCEVERMWGAKAFYRYYFITGIGAGLFHTLITPMSMIPTIGASGAVLGVLTAFAVMFPTRVITLLLFFIFPVRLTARTLVLVFAGLSIINGVFSSPDGVAHFAHLGGMLVGYLYLKKDWRLDSLKKRFGSLFSSRSKMKAAGPNAEELEKMRRLVDKVLDKANEVGMENLTRDEKLFLKRASKILNRNDNE